MRKKKEVDVLFFDLDDTICKTRIKFIEKITECVGFLAKKAPRFSQEEWKRELEQTNNRLFEKQAVNPKRWYLVMMEMKKRYQLTKEVSREATEILRCIYRERLYFLDGAEKALVGLKKGGVKVKIVTHASKKWTRLKYSNWLKLDRFLGWEDVFTINVNEHKTEKSWLEACKFFGVEPKRVAVIGDSPRSDINPARKIGVKKCFLVEDETQWSVHQQPVEEEVIKIKDLTELLDYFHS